jgi:hypothetical protein
MRRLLRFLTSLVRRKKPRGSVNHEFRQGEYRTMVQNICAVLRLAQEPVTPANVMAFAGSLPLSESQLRGRMWRYTFCFRCLKKAYDRTEGTKREKQFNDLFGCCIYDFMNRSDCFKRHRLAVLLGVLGGLSLDGTPGLYQCLIRMHARATRN